MKKSKLFLSFVLAILITFSSYHSSLNVSAQESTFKMHIVSLISGQYYTGNFLLNDNEVYISEDAVLNMAFITTHHQTDAIYLERGTCEAVIPSNETIELNGAFYLPFIKTMEELRLNADMPDLGTLVIEAGEDILQLEKAMDKIYQHKEYDMSGWQNYKILFADIYEINVWTCVMMDVATNIKPISYATGSAQRNQYEEAFKQLIKPSEQDDLTFERQTVKTAETIGDYNSFEEGLFELFSGKEYIGFLGGFGTVCETFSNTGELFQIDDIIDLTAYTKSVKDVEESVIRAISHISSSKNTPALLSDASTLVLEAYRQQNLSIWENVAINIVQDAPEVAESIAAEAFVPGAWLIKAANQTLFKSTQEQISSVIMADRFLDIQRVCKENYLALKSNYNKASTEAKPGYLQLMYDMTNLYLLSGMRAWNAVSIESDLKAIADSRITMIEESLNELHCYTPEDIFLPVYVRNIAEKLKECAEIPFEKFKEPEISGLISRYPSVIVTWDNKEVNGTKLDLNVSMMGELNDGRTFYQEFHEGTYITHEKDSNNFPSLVAMTIRHDQYWETSLEMPNGTFFFEVSPEGLWPTGITITEVNPVITVRIPGQNDIVLDHTDWLERSYTGVWYISFVLENGKIAE